MQGAGGKGRNAGDVMRDASFGSHPAENTALMPTAPTAGNGLSVTRPTATSAATCERSGRKSLDQLASSGDLALRRQTTWGLSGRALTMADERKLPTVTVPSLFGEVVAFEGDLITKQIIEFGNHTRPEFAFALSVLNPEMNVFDLGAHIGTFSMAALVKLGPQARLLAVEGNPDTFALLSKNLEARGQSRVTLHNAFVAPPGAYCYTAREGNTGTGSLMAAAGEQADATIATLTLDDLAAGAFVPDYLKIDVEGAEYAVLNGCKMLQDQRPIIYIEVAQRSLVRFGHSADALERLMRDLNYRFYVNTGERNARHDLFRVREIDSFSWKDGLFDVLCVPEGGPAELALKRACHPKQESKPGLLQSARAALFGR